MITNYLSLQVKKIWLHFKTNSLFQNAIFMMMTTAVMAGFGFFFWIINAHLFSTENIGLATTLISVMTMISSLSLIGFDSAFVRFLPHSEQRNEKLNTGYLLVGLTAFIASVLFIIFVPVISPHISFIRDNPLISLAFIIFSISISLGMLNDAVFLADRNTKYTLMISSFFSLLKMILPFAFIGFGAIGIFTAAALAQSIGFGIGITIIIRKFGYKPRLTINNSVVKLIRKYSFGNYIAGVFGLLPSTVLPILITNNLGSKQAAYYYISMMIGNFLYVIPQATTRSLFAESSHDEHALYEHTKKAINLIALLLIPAIIILFTLGNYILKVFGHGYESGGANFLRLIVISGIAVSVYNVFNSIFRVNKNLISLISSNAIYAASIIGFSYLFLPLGLNGIGIGWFVGNLFTGLGSFILYEWDQLYSYNDETQKELSVIEKVGNSLFDIRNIIFCKFLYIKGIVRNGFKTKTVLFYPEKPKNFHAIYKILHYLGYKITDDTKVKFDLAINFEDQTIKEQSKTLKDLNKKHKVINGGCKDISKKEVDKIFNEVFGYSLMINPKTYSGHCVAKSNLNGKHDGKIINYPTKTKIGYVYQKIVNNQEGDVVLDLRVPIIGNKIPFTYRKYRNTHHRFSNTNSVVLVLDPKMDFNQGEIDKILSFCKKFSLDYGELDILRDNNNNRIYIVDVNDTPAGPPNRLNASDRGLAIDILSKTFKSEFLTK